MKRPLTISQKALGEVLISLKENAEQLEWALAGSPDDILSVISRYHVYLKQNMQQISHLKARIIEQDKKKKLCPIQS